MTPRGASSQRVAPLAAGGVLALASAVAFGATTPLVQRFGHGVGPFTTAALLYGGAALLSMHAGPTRGESPLRARDMPRVAAVAALGAVAAPVALAWGLQRTSGVTASLLLNLEAFFTVVLARVVWGEPIVARVGAALVAMTAGGALLLVRASESAVDSRWGIAAVIVATFAWAGDNAAGRPLADRDPTQVVLGKAALGAVASASLACAFREELPQWPAALALAACGAGGYGLSLRLYLQAQRSIGAARTGSIFACAPFVGAVLAWALGERVGGLATLVAGALCGIGLWLHLTEKHEHEHAHGDLVHSHAHGLDADHRHH
jgi:drug/metabolite transporter (DMT)-like permease